MTLGGPELLTEPREPRMKFRGNLRAGLWIGFFASVLAAWVALWAMGQDRAALSGTYGIELLAGLCAADASAMGYGGLVAMWAVMAMAMMAPTAVPALRTYLDLGHAGARGFWLVLAGYLAVWGGAAFAFAAAQVALSRAALIAPDGASVSLWLSAALFGLAGGYQFSRLKDACLSACRAPLTFFMQHWRPGLLGALGMGLRLGLVCLGCCWALMGLAFVGGMTNLLWMGLATLLMVIEKLPDLGRPLTRPLGWALLAAGAGTAVLAATA